MALPRKLNIAVSIGTCSRGVAERSDWIPGKSSESDTGVGDSLVVKPYRWILNAVHIEC